MENRENQAYTSIEAHRGQVRLHCYRMTGSLFDADDLTQETLLRAWQKLSDFRGESSVLTWLYKIATNLCLDFLKGQKRRRLAHDTEDWLYHTGAELPPALAESLWLEPYPDPADQLIKQEHISLAFLVLLQALPPVQRAVLILCEILNYSANETGRLLAISPSAVNSALQRARKTLGKTPVPAHIEPGDRQALVDRFLQAWERGDAGAIVTLMQADTKLTMPPIPLWARGTTDILRILLDFPFRHGDPRRWKLLSAAGANGQPALGFYELSADNIYRPWGIQVLVLGQATAGQLPPIIEYHVFKGPRLVELFGLPITVDGTFY